MGLVKGWLLGGDAQAGAGGSSGGTSSSSSGGGGLSLFLYVSPSKRVLGCVVAEPVREAFRAVPQLGPAALEQVGLGSVLLWLIAAATTSVQGRECRGLCG